MAARIIKYLPKHTEARTEYVELTEEDHQWLITELMRAVLIMAEMDTLTDDDSRWVRDQWWHRRNSQLPRSQNGPNSPCSVLAGIVWNQQFKTPAQRDFSRPQLEAIEQITHILAQVKPIEAVRFQVGFA